MLHSSEIPPKHEDTSGLADTTGGEQLRKHLIDMESYRDANPPPRGRFVPVVQTHDWPQSEDLDPKIGAAIRRLLVI